MNASSSRLIQSRHNRVYKDLKRILTGRGIRSLGRALLAGEKLIQEALRVYPDRCVAVLSPTNRPEAADLGRAGERSLEEYRLSPELFHELDVSGTHHPLLMVTVPEFPQWDPTQSLPEGCTLLLPFQDPDNIGAVIRSAVAFGATRIVLLAEAAHPFHPKSVRAASGTVLAAEFMDGPSLDELPDMPAIVPLTSEGKDIAGFDFPPELALLPGLEGKGLPPKWRDRGVAIPHRPEAESLNAAAATAIALYLWSRQN